MKILKILAIAFLAIATILALAIWIASEPLPEGKEGPQAEALADKMLLAVNKAAYDSLQELQWSFPRGHNFVWDKAANKVNVQWDKYEVSLDPETRTGTASADGASLSGQDATEAVAKAWALFANDSFWLVAPFKVRDPGAERRLVETESGPALLVTYNTGGVTPGDSYLWILDENGRPTAWKMWVSILPVKGLEFSWDGWTSYGGAWFAPTHQGPGPVSVNLTGLQIR